MLKDQQTIMAYLSPVLVLIEHEGLRYMCYDVLRDPKFLASPAARQKHQAYPGGLLVHTWEVIDIAYHISQTSAFKLDKDVLFTACVFHDYGKIYDYTTNEKGEIVYTEHNKLIRHLPRSYAMFMEMASKATPSVSDDLKNKVGHCILAHHGRLEWQSPVEPQIPEAFVLHFADMLSANCSKDINAPAK